MFEKLNKKYREKQAKDRRIKEDDNHWQSSSQTHWKDALIWTTITAKELRRRFSKIPYVWLVDCGATHHLSFHRELFDEIRPCYLTVHTGNSTTKASGIGTVTLTLGSDSIRLRNVLYVPDLHTNILSTERLRKDNMIGYNSFDNSIFDGEDGRVIIEADSSSGLPLLNTSNPSTTEQLNSAFVYYHEARTKPISLDLAHRRLGHISEAQVRRLAYEAAEGLKLLPNSGREGKCEHCVAGQIRKIPIDRDQLTNVRSSRPLEMIHMDLLDAGFLALGTGYRYLWVIVDDYSRHVWVTGLKSKDIRESWKVWRAMTKTQYSDILDDTRIDTIKIIRADNGGEFIKDQMQKTWEAEGIRLELTIAYAHN
jgi:Integrase core domain